MHDQELLLGSDAWAVGDVSDPWREALIERCNGARWTQMESPVVSGDTVLYG